MLKINMKHKAHEYYVLALVFFLQYLKSAFILLSLSVSFCTPVQASVGSRITTCQHHIICFAIQIYLSHCDNSIKESCLSICCDINHFFLFYKNVGGIKKEILCFTSLMKCFQLPDKPFFHHEWLPLQYLILLSNVTCLLSLKPVV